MESWKEYFDKYGTYLEEIRRRLYRLLIIFCGAFLIGFFSTTSIIKAFMSFFTVHDATIIATSPFQLLDLAMSTGSSFAIIITFPIFLQQVYTFLRSGLTPRERTLFLRLIPIAIILFGIGFLYGCTVMYYALGVVATVNVDLGIANFWDISQLISMITLTSVLLGILFEFPLVLSFLIQKGMTTTDFLVQKRRHAYVVILVLVTLLPPTDGLSDIIIAAPLVLIYELTILFNSNHSRRDLQK